MDDNEIRTTLLVRSYIYQLGQRLLGDKPGKELFDVVFSEATASLGEFFVEPAAKPVATALQGLLQQGSTYAEDKAAFIVTAERDYNEQFVGPHALKAPPWECVYRTGERILFQAQTLAVREAYRSENLLPAEYPHVPDDFIAIELDFMAKLAGRTELAYNAGDFVEVKRLLVSQKSFLDEHLSLWIGDYVDDLVAVVPSSVYAATALLCKTFVSYDAQLIRETDIAIPT